MFSLLQLTINQKLFVISWLVHLSRSLSPSRAHTHSHSPIRSAYSIIVCTHIDSLSLTPVPSFKFRLSNAKVSHSLTLSCFIEFFFLPVIRHRCEGVTLRAQLLRNHHNVCCKSKAVSKRRAEYDNERCVVIGTI